MIEPGFTLAGILLVFYLYLLVRWQHVRRPTFYLIGAGGLGLVFLGQFILFAGGTVKVVAILARIVDLAGVLAALAGAVGACYGAKLPIGEEIERGSETASPSSLRM